MMMHGKEEMIMAFDYKKEYPELYRPGMKPTIIEVPSITYLAVRGKGNPNEEGGTYQDALSILYAVSYTLKMSYKTDYSIDGFFQYVVPPLEGLWWMDDMSEPDFTDKAGFNWISMIRLPEFIGEYDVRWAVKTAEKKKGIDCSSLEILTLEEGVCVQMMHLGSYDDEPESISAMLEYAKNEGYVKDMNSQRLHHEIYLSDPRRVKPEKLKTVIRIPVRKK